MVIKYRPDIDGLRAVAVLAVLFFHAGLPFFEGGYVGVDIFFVISGYLITSIILREINQGKFSILQFYERRFRRILPPLIVVVFLTLIAGLYLLPSDGILGLGYSAITTALMSSNMLFYFESGYFGGAAEMKPLLHTWSLAVEEQFYIFFPLILIFISKRPKAHYLRYFLILGFLSLVACILLTQLKPSAAFYWIPTRTWELLIGSLLALQVFPTLSKSSSEALSFTGAALIFAAIFTYDAQTPFPGYTALLPTIGTALIIYTGGNQTPWVNRLLSLKPVVFIGLISYSLYLWHWPIIVYTKIWNISHLDYLTISLMLLIIMALSILSWKFIEGPMRQKKILAHQKPLLTASLIVMSLMVVFGWGLVREGSQSQTKDPLWKKWNSCQKVSQRLRNQQGLCSIGASQGEPEFLLWGDSHAKALASGVNLSAQNSGVKGYIATRSACPPLSSIGRPGQAACPHFNQSVLNFLAESPQIHTVILGGRWALSAQGTRYKQEYGQPVQLMDLEPQSAAQNFNGVQAQTLFEKGLIRSLKKLHELGKKVIIVSGIPEVGLDVPHALNIAHLRGLNIDQVIAPSWEEYQLRQQEVSEFLQKLETHPGITIIHPSTKLCNQYSCQIEAETQALYRDDDHLSTWGSLWISSIYDEVWRGFKPQ